MSIVPTDRSGSALASASFAGNEAANSFIDLPISDLSAITDWIAGNNSGLVLIRRSSVTQRAFVHSSESNTVDPPRAAYHPELIIDYTPLMAIPSSSPWSLALLGLLLLGVLAVWPRR